MAQTRRSQTTKLANGDRVTVTTGNTRGGYYKTVTVKRRDGTGESVTDRRNAGLFGTGLLDIRGPYRDDVPVWAGGNKPEGNVLGVVVIVLIAFAIGAVVKYPLYGGVTVGIGIALLFGVPPVLRSRQRRVWRCPECTGTFQPFQGASASCPHCGKTLTPPQSARR